MNNRLSRRIAGLEQGIDQSLSDDIRAWLGDIPASAAHTIPPVEPAKVRLQIRSPSMDQWLRERA